MHMHLPCMFNYSSNKTQKFFGKAIFIRNVSYSAFPELQGAPYFYQLKKFI